MTIEDTRLPPFTVTPAAIDEIEAAGGVVRLDVVDGGCCGRTYAFTLGDSAPAAGDERFGCRGAYLDISEAAADVLTGATLDYSGKLKPPRFRVLRNPNTEEICACRRSFGAPWPGPGQPTCRSYSPMPWDGEYDPPRGWKRQTGYRD